MCGHVADWLRAEDRMQPNRTRGGCTGNSKSRQKEARTGRYIEKQSSNFAKYLIRGQALKSEVWWTRLSIMATDRTTEHSNQVLCPSEGVDETKPDKGEMT